MKAEATAVCFSINGGVCFRERENNMVEIAKIPNGNEERIARSFMGI